jgi:anhydro-N-acetylmuramic acid kinase
MAINYMMNKINLSMDKDGEIAKRGFLDDNLLKVLNNMDFHSRAYPKSLGKEWFDSMFIPIIDNTYLSFDDILRTIYEHIAQQIANVVIKSKGKILITGGGAHNKYLISLIKEKVQAEVVVPNSNLIDFKEALIFAFLGLLRFKERNNCLSSVTGAAIDCSGGVIHKT